MLVQSAVRWKLCINQPEKFLSLPQELTLCFNIWNSWCETHLKRLKRALPACKNSLKLVRVSQRRQFFRKDPYEAALQAAKGTNSAASRKEGEKKHEGSETVTIFKSWGQSPMTGHSPVSHERCGKVLKRWLLSHFWLQK